MGSYHAGSLALQELVGVSERADHVGRSLGRDVKPVAAAFLEQQPLLVVGAADPRSGLVWASPLTGPPGFARAAGPGRLSVATKAGGEGPGKRAPGHPAEQAPDDVTHPDGGPLLADPLSVALRTPGTHLGTLALDPRTRRRMRLNGRLRPTEGGFEVEADRVFANCPRHIRRREAYETVAGRVPGLPRRAARLGPGEAEFVRAADTFFLATVHRAGADVSHRGGDPGFVRVLSPRELSWPDYPGNAMFLSLGNLRTDPRAGLLLLDWDTGTTLQLTGEARTVFAADGRRTVRFTVTEARWAPAALPLRWSAPAHSPAGPDGTR
ncbi:pyridoxamine 5'-phosphate oxidase family protein [Streptomyces sp. NPDC048514]|uniref:pyridoxamine 5'-phosphate oxidase family protein n=1 Tax=Streptomyces sp. NPDC048514 TaxID=3365564 RepID=UPI00371F43AD